MTIKDIMNIVPTIHAASLLDDTVKKSKKGFSLKSATNIIIGSSLIKAESNLISQL